MSISQLPNLQHVYLSFNKLNGSLGGRFCTRSSDPLEALILRSNYFTGTADLTPCKQLLLLDLTVSAVVAALLSNAVTAPSSRVLCRAQDAGH